MGILNKRSYILAIMWIGHKALCLRTTAIYGFRQRTVLFSTSARQSSHFPSGIIPVYKPKDWSSNDVVSKLKWIILNGLREETPGLIIRNNELKVGHGGTLDPMAEGVLVIGINKGTKQMKTFLSGEKEYRVVGKFGTSTDTYDATGVVSNTIDHRHINSLNLRAAIKEFSGETYQVPPMFSALKHNGKRLYEYARKGVQVERPPRKVFVHDISFNETSEYKLPDEFELVIKCGGGFYVRTLIHDLGLRLNTCAHMTSLVRTKHGPFPIENCLYENSWNIDSIRKSISSINKIE